MNRDKLIERFLDKAMPEPNCGCWFWTGAQNAKGYGFFWYDQKMVKAHRISWKIFRKTKIPNRMYVCHSCDEPSCVNPDHLWVGDATANNHDCINKGRMKNALGQNHGRSKLTNENVKLIKTLLKQGVSQTKIAKRFFITPSTISRISSGERWSHIT